MTVAELKQKHGLNGYYLRGLRFYRARDQDDVSDKSIWIAGPPPEGWPVTEFNNKIVIL